MKRILYLNNYMSQDHIHIRHNSAIYSQPANNKVEGILLSLVEAGCCVEILSSGLVNSKSGRFFRKLEGEKLHGVAVTYCGILDLPLMNTVTSILAMYNEIKRKHTEKKIDQIVFYNYKPEVAWAAYLAKKILHIPITVEYEDGYSYVDSMSKFKRWIFTTTEKVVSKEINSAIVVNSQIANQYSVPTVVVRGVVKPEFSKQCKLFEKKQNGLFTILYSGGLDRTRGVDVLVEALQYVDIDCRVVITGKGKREFKDPRIDFKGFVSYEEAVYWMQQADVLLQCQLVNDDFAEVSFPSKLFEYIATGNPVISSDLPEVKRFAGDAFTYYENDDPRSLAKALEKLYHSFSAENKTAMLCEENMPAKIGHKLMTIL